MGEEFRSARISSLFRLKRFNVLTNVTVINQKVNKRDKLKLARPKVLTKATKTIRNRAVTFALRRRVADASSVLVTESSPSLVLPIDRYKVVETRLDNRIC